jgi:hypothetical protein
MALMDNRTQDLVDDLFARLARVSVEADAIMLMKPEYEIERRLKTIKMLTEDINEETKKTFNLEDTEGDATTDP